MTQEMVFEVCRAGAQDLTAIKALAALHRVELGFVNRAALERSIERRELYVAVRNHLVIGFLDFHRRRDGQITLYHIAVEPATRGQGVGRALLGALDAAGREAGCRQILLKCPTDLSANGFYRAYGFRLEETLNGRKRPLNVWVLPLVR